jgi:hypothetical protein
MAKRKKRIFMHEKAFLTVFLCNFSRQKKMNHRQDAILLMAEQKHCA